MTRNKKILIGVVLVLLAAMCIWTVQSVPDRVKDAPPLEKRVMTYNGNTIVEEKDGRKLWEMTAESMEVDIDTQDAVIDNLDAKFYTEDGRTIHLTAPKANYKAKEKFLTAEGGIKGDSTDGAHMQCDTAEWRAAEEKIALIGNAELQRDLDAVKAAGDRIESKDGFNKFKITGHAHLEKGNKK